MTEREKVKRNEKPSSWFKGLANSPIVSKFMRSNTSGISFVGPFFTR